jgi:glycosyltransferase involved in cell wall biosynthesis
MPEAKTSCLRITILLPLAGTHPIGGFKVAYEYANYLAGKGHIVSVVHAARLLIDEPVRSMGLKPALRTIRLYFKNRFTGNFKPSSWFAVSPAVKLLWAPSLSAKYIPDGDIVLATAWQTAEWAAEYPPSKGKKFYLIQHLETWSGPEDRVFATWKLPLRKIVIARWLQRTAEEFGQTAELVHNGLDFERFRLIDPQDGRDPNNILMPYQASLDWKGSPDGLAAFELARQQQPSLRLSLYGRDAPPPDLPPGVVYHRDPPQELLRDLYNKASIFLLPSWTEGWPLPPAEALQCGAAIVVTDIEGTAAYAIHEQTALRSPVRDPAAMAANILRLVRDPELRLRLAQAGHAAIQEFTWERAGSSLEGIFLRSADPAAAPAEAV